MTKADLRALIEENSIPIPMTGCWLWLRSYGSHSYGALRLPGAKNMTTAPRVAFEAWHGKLRKREVPRHTCHQKWCCAPHHLVRGSHRANMLDKFRDETSAWWSPKVRGPLSVANVLEIRRLYAEERISSSLIGERFGITRQAVMNIVSRRSWKHLPVAGVLSARG